VAVPVQYAVVCAAPECTMTQSHNDTMTCEQKKRARQWLWRQDGRQHKQEKPHRLLNA